MKRYHPAWDLIVAVTGSPMGSNGLLTFLPIPLQVIAAHRQLASGFSSILAHRLLVRKLY